MIMPDRLTATIVHSIHGRMRLLLSDPPRNEEAILSGIKGHAGIVAVRYTTLMQSLLIEYDPQDVAKQELLIRVALAWSLDCGGVPVRVLSEQESRDLSGFELLAGALLVAAVGLRLVGGAAIQKNRMEWIAGLGTAGAVAGHGWTEWQKKGYFDPEVVSLAYLLVSLIKGNLLTASVFTWFTTFGRHLMPQAPVGVVIKPVLSKNTAAPTAGGGVIVAPDESRRTVNRVARAVGAILQLAVTGGAKPASVGLIEEIREVARVHGEVLEGLGNGREDIPLSFQ
jgi:hypothetical protein